MTVETRDYVMKEYAGDTLTPIAIYSALKGSHKVLFESNAKYNESGRYSFIAASPIAELKGDANDTYYRDETGTAQQLNVPVLTQLKKDSANA